MMQYFLNLLYVYLIGCAFLTACFGMEAVLNWWESLDEFDIGEYSALEEAEWKERSRNDATRRS